MSFLDWLREGQKVVHHMSAYILPPSFLHLQWFIYYKETQVTLCRIRWPFLLLNQRESLGCRAKGFWKFYYKFVSLFFLIDLQQWVSHSSPFCPYSSTHLPGMTLQCWANPNWVISHRNWSSETFFFLLQHLCFMMGIRDLINVPLPGMGGQHNTIFSFLFFSFITLCTRNCSKKSRMPTIFTWKIWPF